MYTNPGFPADNGLSYLNYSDGAMAEHVASFELLSAGKIKPELLQQQFDRIQQAAAMGKTVVMSTWPGLLVSAFNFGFPSLSGCCGTSGGLTWTGTNGPIWKQTMLQNHTWALALYLTVAEENVWMQYQLWYNGQTQGAIPCEIRPVARLRQRQNGTQIFTSPWGRHRENTPKSAISTPETFCTPPRLSISTIQ